MTDLVFGYLVLLGGFLVVGSIALIQSHLLKRIRKEKIVTTKKGTYTFTPNGVKI